MSFYCISFQLKKVRALLKSCFGELRPLRLDLVSKQYTSRRVIFVQILLGNWITEEYLAILKLVHLHCIFPIGQLATQMINDYPG